MMIKVWTLLVALACSAAAFAPTARPAQNHVAALRMVGERPEIAGVARFFGVFAAAAVFAFNPLSEASATAPASRNSISSSELSDSLMVFMASPLYEDTKSNNFYVYLVSKIKCLC